MNALGIALVWCAVQVTLFGLLAAAVYLVCRRWQPASGTSVTVAVLAGILVLSAMALSPWPRWSLPEHIGETTEAASEREAPAEDHGATAATSPDAASSVEAGPVEEATPARPSFGNLLIETLNDALGAQAVPPEADTRPWTAVVGIAFAAAAGIGAMWLVAGLVSVRVYRSGTRPITEAALAELVDVLRAEMRCRRPIELRESDTLVTAATVGWRRSVVILPADWRGWTDDQRRAVLAHEIAHVRDGHFLGVLCGQFGLVLHFYHPLVHWLVHRLRLEQELAADAAAAVVMGGQREYLTAIAELALHRSGRPLVWPARSFLPTRNMFLRRIAMLRDAKLQPGRLQPAARWAVLGVVFACAVLVAGLRGPATQRQAIALESAPEEMGPVEEAIDLTHVPSGARAIVVFRPAGVFARPELIQFGESLSAAPGPLYGFGLSLAKLEQAMFVLLDVPERAKDMPLFILQYTEPTDFALTIRAWIPEPAQKESRGKSYFAGPLRGSSAPGVQVVTAAYVRPDDRTVVIGLEEDVQQFLAAPKGERPSFLDETCWQSFREGQFLIAAEASLVRGMLQLPEYVRMAPGFAPFAPLWEESEAMALGLRLDGRLLLQGIVGGKSKESAAKIAVTLQAAKTLAVNSLGQLRQQRPQSLEAELSTPLVQLLGNLQVEQQEATVRLRSATETETMLGERLAEAVIAARQAAERAKAMNNVKQIALAMHMFHDSYRHFPPAVLHRAPRGPAGESEPYSWRVALLPFLGQMDLHKEYRFDEPWDSPANKQVLEKMPDVYRDPGDPAESTSTSYFALTGPETAFSEEGGTPITQIRDAAANTMLAVEAKRSVPWTKPEDLPYDPEKPLPELGGHVEGGFLAAFCDASVHFLPKDLDEALLRKLIEKADGQPVDMSKIYGQDPRRAAVRRKLMEERGGERVELPKSRER